MTNMVLSRDTIMKKLNRGITVSLEIMKPENPKSYYNIFVKG